MAGYILLGEQWPLLLLPPLSVRRQFLHGCPDANGCLRCHARIDSTFKEAVVKKLSSKANNQRYPRPLLYKLNFETALFFKLEQGSNSKWHHVVVVAIDNNVGPVNGITIAAVLQRLLPEEGEGDSEITLSPPPRKQLLLPSCIYDKAIFEIFSSTRSRRRPSSKKTIAAAAAHVDDCLPPKRVVENTIIRFNRLLATSRH